MAEFESEQERAASSPSERIGKIKNLQRFPFSAGLNLLYDCDAD